MPGPKRFLVAYATREGHTAKVADEIASVGREMGIDVDLCLVGAVDKPVGDYDGVCLGGSIHMSNLEPELITFARENAAALSAVEASLFIVCLAANEKSEAADAEVGKYLNTFVEESGFSPGLMTAFAGALRYSTYGLVKKVVLRWIAKKSGLPTDTSHDYEFTDWDSVDAFAEDVIGVAAGVQLGEAA